MDPDLSPLDSFLEDDFDGYLLVADGEDSDQRYLSGFDAPDPFVTLYTPDALRVLVSNLEYGRARREGRAEDVFRFSDYDYRELADEHGAQEGQARVVAAFLDDHDVDEVAVPWRFPAGVADVLRSRGIGVTAESDGVITDIRSRKVAEEIAHIREAQRANEAAMAAAEGLLSEAEIGGGSERFGERFEGNVLVYEGEPLTSERLKEEIERTLLEHGCGLDETIVACGADAADPHERGSGPLSPGQTIVIDIFPRNKTTGYHADMTRTFVVGEPTAEVRRRHEVVDEARRAALDAVGPGTTGAAVHDAACDVIETAGYVTLRSDPQAETGFIHSTGHGIGLDVHERPTIGPDGGQLKPGHVVTIEPGLYDPDVGGIRIEDLVVVTDDGYENLTDYPIELVVA